MTKMESYFRQKRHMMPKRTKEVIALIVISSILFLFIHTRGLNTKLMEVEKSLQSDDRSTIFDEDNSDEEDDSSEELVQLTPLAHLLINREVGPLNVNVLNNTMRAEKEVLFFNRVPKVGSQTFMELLRELAPINNYKAQRDPPQREETIYMKPDLQEKLVNQIAAYSTPSTYVKHVCFTNFTKFNLPTPIYINLVRDPIERVISWYYYVRAPFYLEQRKITFPDLPPPEPSWLNKSFESCVLNGDQECTYIQGEWGNGIGDHRRQTLFFCGHEFECLPFNTVGAMERAKANVEKYYAVVGVLEELNSTLTVFEHYIPKFFRAASYYYYLNNFHLVNRNTMKPVISEHVKEIVRKNFTREIEFYQFCKQRLHKQLWALRLPSETGS